MAMKKVTVAMTEEMYQDLEKERKERRLASVAETARVIIGDYLARYRQSEDPLRPPVVEFGESRLPSGEVRRPG